MSEENVNLTKRSIEHFNRHGAPDPSAFDPNVEWWTRSDLPVSGVHRGYDVSRFRAGKCVEVREYATLGEALRAVGVREVRAPHS